MRFALDLQKGTGPKYVNTTQQGESNGKKVAVNGDGFNPAAHAADSGRAGGMGRTATVAKQPWSGGNIMAKRFCPREGEPFEIWNDGRKHQVVRLAEVVAVVIIIPCTVGLLDHALWENRQEILLVIINYSSSVRNSFGW